MQFSFRGSKSTLNNNNNPTLHGAESSSTSVEGKDQSCFKGNDNSNSGRNANAHFSSSSSSTSANNSLYHHRQNLHHHHHHHDPAIMADETFHTPALIRSPVHHKEGSFGNNPATRRNLAQKHYFKQSSKAVAVAVGMGLEEQGNPSSTLIIQENVPPSNHSSSSSSAERLPPPPPPPPPAATAAAAAKDVYVIDSECEDQYYLDALDEFENDFELVNDGGGNGRNSGLISDTHNPVVVHHQLSDNFESDPLASCNTTTRTVLQQKQQPVSATSTRKTCLFTPPKTLMTAARKQEKSALSSKEKSNSSRAGIMSSSSISKSKKSRIVSSDDNDDVDQQQQQEEDDQNDFTTNYRPKKRPSAVHTSLQPAKVDQDFIETVIDDELYDDLNENLNEDLDENLNEDLDENLDEDLDDDLDDFIDDGELDDFIDDDDDDDGDGDNGHDRINDRFNNRLNNNDHGDDDDIMIIETSDYRVNDDDACAAREENRANAIKPNPRTVIQSASKYFSETFPSQNQSQAQPSYHLIDPDDIEPDELISYLSYYEKDEHLSPLKNHHSLSEIKSRGKAEFPDLVYLIDRMGAASKESDRSGEGDLLQKFQEKAESKRSKQQHGGNSNYGSGSGRGGGRKRFRKFPSKRRK